MKTLTRKIFLLCGLPGSGKGTQLELLTGSNLVGVSCGDFFRSHVNRRTPFGQLALGHIKAGTLTPDEETSKMFFGELEQFSGLVPIMMEGYPRTSAQLDHFNSFLDSKGWKLETAFYLRVRTEELVARIADRMVCPCCRRVFKKSELKQAVCPSDRSELEVREDDSPLLIERRIAFYARAEEEVMERLRKLNVLLDIDGGLPSHEIAALLRTAISDKLRF